MRRGPGILGGAWAGLLLFFLFVSPGHGHPLPLPPPASPDAVRLGMDEAALRKEVGEALQPGLLSRKEAPAPATGLTAFHRRFPPGSDLAYAEYELFRGKVYRIRWRLAERFERPLFPRLVDRLTHHLGAPLHNQTVEAELGSGEATLRRASWRWGPGTIEARQLDPQYGGPLYLTWLDAEAVESILDARLSVPPQPDQVPPWWEGELAFPKPLAKGEEEPLLQGIEALLASWLKATPAASSTK